MTVSSDQYLVFEVAGLTLLCALAEVQEILKPETLSPVAGAQPWFQGMAAHQGRAIPVSDLGDYLFGQPSGAAPSAQWLAVKATDEIFALVVDAVVGVSDAVTKPMHIMSGRDQSETATGVLPGTAEARAGVTAEPVQLDGNLAYLVTLPDLLTQDSFIDIRAIA